MLIRLDKYLADMQVGTRSEVKELIRKKKKEEQHRRNKKTDK